MARKPQAKIDFVAKARAAWGGSPPDWVLALAEEATRTRGGKAAARIGYSAAVVTHVIGNTYTGDLERVALRVRGALMGETVTCPMLGAIGRDRCLDEQRKPRSATSSVRAKLWRHCHGIGAPLCPHSRIESALERAAGADARRQASGALNSAASAAVAAPKNEGGGR